jgi:hypothetical protein
MNQHVRAGQELGRRVIDANGGRIYQLAGPDRAAFVAGFLTAVVGGCAGLVGAAATEELLINLQRQLLAAERDATEGEQRH